MKKRGYINSRLMAAHLYEQGTSLTEMSAILGLTTGTVRRFLREQGIHLPPRKPPGGCRIPRLIISYHGRDWFVRDLSAVLGISPENAGDSKALLLPAFTLELMPGKNVPKGGTP